MVDISALNPDTRDKGYEKYKTPFFDIQIAAADKKKLIPFPEQLYRLIEKVEIIRTFDLCIVNDIINITFIEGSREPYIANDNVDTRDLYNIGSGVVTNKPGLLTDLRFNKAGTGITVLDNLSANINPGALLDTTTIDSPITGSGATSRNIQIEKSKAGTNIKYLLQEGNFILLTWGYKEQPEKIKRVVSRIQIVQTDFPENDHPRTNITCQGFGTVLDKLTSPIGVQLFKTLPAGVDVKSGKILLKQFDTPTPALIREICSKAGIKCIVSDNLDAVTLDKAKGKKLIAGQSLHQFLKELADRHNAYYMPFYDPESLDPVISFISRTDFEKTSTIEDQNRYVYKASGSLIKNISVKVDFGGLTGFTNSGYDINGKFNATISDNGGDKYLVLYSGQKQINSDPVAYEQSAKSISTQLFEGKSNTGKVQINPEADSNKNLTPLTQTRAACMTKLVTIEFTTIGDTEIDPGQTIKFQNIGERYSGQYNILTVSHILDTNGYVCRGTAKSGVLAGGIGADTKFLPGQESEKFANVQLFQPKVLNQAATNLTGSLTDSSPKEEHDKKRK